jgi:2-dehydropantoate 2-reductase
LLPDGTIRHVGKGDSLAVGARAPETAELAAAFHRLIGRTPGTRELSVQIEQALWNKWAMISAAAMMTCLMRGTVGDIVRTRDGRELMRRAMAESGAVAALSGYPLPEPVQQALQARLLDENSTWAASMMRDIAQGADKLEADDLVGDLIARAERFGQDLPLARVAYCHLQVYQGQHATRGSAP